MSKLTAHQKRLKLAKFVEIRVSQGYDISGVFAKPLNSFNYDFIDEIIRLHEKENN